MALKTALKIIRANTGFILTTHQSPDGDGIGSVYALCRGLQSLGKDCLALLPQEIPGKFAYIDKKRIFKRVSDGPQDLADRILLILDTNDGQNLGALSDSLVPRAKSVFFIDHHEAPSDFPSACWIDVKAAATAEMALDILEALGARIQPDMATALLTGIVYDTGSFIYRKTSERSFKAALTLVRAGASPSYIHERLYENSSVASLILMKKALSSLEMRSGGRIACMSLSKGDFLESGAHYEDAEGLINIPLQVADVQASLLFKENPETGLRCSLRSKGLLNVAAIAQHFGGGGHATAAGMKYSGGMADAKRELTALTETVLNGGSIPKPERMRPPKNVPGPGRKDPPKE